jgi:single-strand DNA-binding protein
MKSNYVLLIGYVGLDIVMKTASNGSKRVSLRVATHNGSRRNEKGQFIDKSTWHDVVAWDKTAEYAERSFVKGSKLLVEGKIIYKTYADKHGHKRYVTEIKAYSLQNLDR